MQNNKLSGFLFRLFIFLLLSYLIFNLLSCQKSTEPLFNASNLQLQVLDVSCTEAWLLLRTEITEKTEKDSAEWELNLFRNDSLIANKPFTAADSIIYTDGLQPATTYSFSAKLLKNGKLQATSNQVTATTMDTTSHDFTWQTFEFGGQGGSSSFYDVAIIDENDIWAVGEIYTTDDKYNAAHWNGEKWELRKIANDSYPRRVVFAFGKNDVWFDGTIKWDGSKYTVHMKNFPLLPNGNGWYKNAMWGTSNEDFYLVGDKGMIAHYDGLQWQRIESGTDYVINDIYGLNHIILCAAGDTYKANQGMVLKIINQNYTLHLEWDEKNATQSVYIVNAHKFYIAGYKLFSNRKNQWCEIPNALPAFGNMIRGTGANDIFVACDNLKIAHFNGKTWQYFFFNKIAILESIAVSKKVVVSCGYDARKAYIIMGKR